MAVDKFWATFQFYIRARDRVIYQTTKDPETIKAIKLKYNLK